MKAEFYNLAMQRLPSLLMNNLEGIALIYVFGSQVSGLSHEESDIDIAILCNKKLDPVTRWNIQSELEHELNIDVDLIDLLEASTVIQHQVIFNGICIFNPLNKKAAFEIQVMSMYQHLNFERHDILQEYIK